jgi:hypothetical protein
MKTTIDIPDVISNYEGLLRAKDNIRPLSKNSTILWSGSGADAFAFETV